MEQQNQNFQVEEGISLLDIIKLLMNKIKILILVVIIGGIAGGSFAIWRTIDINYFGTKVEFYVNPERPEESAGEVGSAGSGGSQYGVYGAYGRHVMDNMIKLLSSDSFAEQLLLNGASLPAKHDADHAWFSDVHTVKVDGEERFLGDLLNEAIDAAQEPLAALAEAKKNLDEALAAKDAAMDDYNDAEEQLNIIWREQLYNKGLVSKSTFNEAEYFDKVDKNSTAAQAVTVQYDEYIRCQSAVTKRMMEVNNFEDTWKSRRKVANEAVEFALEYWRQSPVYVSQLNFFKNSISYSYLDGNENSADANNLARSFIYVKISICDADPEEGYAKASQLLQRVKKVVPEYVETNMTVPDGYVGTNCKRITRTDNIRLTNPNYTTMQAIKYGILFGAAAFVLASVLIIFLDRADQRLRDTDIISSKFNVPLLGIVPTIDELKAEQVAKKVEQSVRKKKQKAEQAARRRAEKAEQLAKKREQKRNNTEVK